MFEVGERRVSRGDGSACPPASTRDGTLEDRRWAKKRAPRERLNPTTSNWTARRAHAFFFSRRGALAPLKLEKFYSPFPSASSRRSSGRSEAEASWVPLRSETDPPPLLSSAVAGWLRHKSSHEPRLSLHLLLLPFAAGKRQASILIGSQEFQYLENVDEEACLLL